MLRGVSIHIKSLLVLFALASPAFGQGGGGRAEINGTIMDQGQAVLPGVTVTVINEATNLERQAVTGGEGRFVIPTLVPGTYTIKAELQGFQTTTRKGVVVNVGQELTVNLTLNLPAWRRASPSRRQLPLVETTVSTIGTNISAQRHR